MKICDSLLSRHPFCGSHFVSLTFCHLLWWNYYVLKHIQRQFSLVCILFGCKDMIISWFWQLFWIVQFLYQNAQWWWLHTHLDVTTYMPEISNQQQKGVTSQLLDSHDFRCSSSALLETFPHTLFSRHTKFYKVLKPCSVGEWPGWLCWSFHAPVFSLWFHKTKNSNCHCH